jgi:hypothetical protein
MHINAVGLASPHPQQKILGAYLTYPARKSHLLGAVLYCIVIYGLSGFTILSTLSHKRHDFAEKNSE